MVSPHGMAFVADNSGNNKHDRDKNKGKKWKE
jgi:hypothetical protein